MAREAGDHHRGQVEACAGTPAGLVTAITMIDAEEVVGIAHAAGAAGIPAAISFTVETDGHLPTGEGLPMAIEHVDEIAAACVPLARGRAA